MGWSGSVDLLGSHARIILSSSASVRQSGFVSGGCGVMVVQYSEKDIKSTAHAWRLTDLTIHDCICRS